MENCPVPHGLTWINENHNPLFILYYNFIDLLLKSPGFETIEEFTCKFVMRMLACASMKE